MRNIRPTRLTNPTHRLLAISFSALALLSALALFHAAPSLADEWSGPPTSAHNSPASHAADWWAAVQADLRRQEYHVTWQESPLAPGASAGYQAPNRAHNLRIGFNPTGIRLVERAAVCPTWSTDIALIGFGSLGHVRPVAAAELVVSGNRVTYRRGSLTEWYVNDERGLEQGFRISNPKPQTVLELSLGGDLIPRLTDGQTIEFALADGPSTSSGQSTPVLRYGPPRATDATGHPLPARFSDLPSPLSVLIDASAATSPVTLRLTLTAFQSSPSWSAESDQAGAVFGWSVSTAGDVDGDGYADVIVGAPRYDRGQTEEGAAFLYLGGSGGLATTPAWMGESDQAWAWFGQAVATAGDVNNDGYSDVVVGAPRYDISGTVPLTDTGKAFVYHGGPTGLVTTTTWSMHLADQAQARFGSAVATAGDVNGDGYADVIVTANGYDGEEVNEGGAFVYHGGPSGLVTTTAWIAHPTDQAYANFGRAASTAGDVNGDGYSDLVVGAPWYDVSEQDEDRDMGVVYVYHGGPTGLVTTATFTTTGDTEWAKLGMAVSTAGDVNGDGYSDVVLGAYQRTGSHWRNGAVFVYHGGVGGLGTGPAWSAEGDQNNAKFGLAVSTAGDVDGDGYSDVVVGAPSDANGESNEGGVFCYLGGPGGVITGPAWSAESDQEGAGLGYTVSAAGDVDGDGSGDVVAGAPAYNGGQTDEGAAFVYPGDDGDSLLARPRQLRSDGLTPIAPLGFSDSANQVHLHLAAQPPQGVVSATLQWQIAPLGTPFTAATTISGTSPAWSDVLTGGLVLSQTVDGLTAGTVYRWRMRMLYQPGGQSRWLYLPWNGPHEADFRTPSLLSPGQNGRIPPGHLAVYTHTLINPISRTQTLTLSAMSSQGYTATVLTPSGRPTVALPPFTASPVTLTVETPSTAPLGTQDTTVVTATSDLSGHDAALDITTVTLSNVYLPLILRGFPPS
jgi:hypothetical protein